MYLTDYLIYAFLLLAGVLAGILLRMKSSSRYPVPRRSATLTQAQQRPTLDRGEPRVYSQPSANPYVRCFLRARLLSSRHAVYIDTNVHDTLWRVVRACGVRNITLSSYVDAIVREHLERYRTQIEALHAPADENSARDVHRNVARSVPYLRSAQVFPSALRGRCRKSPAPALCSGSRHGSGDNVHAGVAGHHP